MVVFGVTYFIAAAIYAVVMVLATGERARAFKAVSPGILSPLGVIFGLFVAFTAVQVWNDNDRANAAVDRRIVTLLRYYGATATRISSRSFPTFGA